MVLFWSHHMIAITNTARRAEDAATELPNSSFLRAVPCRCYLALMCSFPSRFCFDFPFQGGRYIYHEHFLLALVVGDEPSYPNAIPDMFPSPIAFHPESDRWLHDRDPTRADANVIPVDVGARVYGGTALMVKIVHITPAALAKDFEVKQLSLSKLLIFQTICQRGSSS